MGGLNAATGDIPTFDSAPNLTSRGGSEYRDPNFSEDQKWDKPATRTAENVRLIEQFHNRFELHDGRRDVREWKVEAVTPEQTRERRVGDQCVTEKLMNAQEHSFDEKIVVCWRRIFYVDENLESYYGTLTGVGGRTTGVSAAGAGLAGARHAAQGWAIIEGAGAGMAGEMAAMEGAGMALTGSTIQVAGVGIGMFIGVTAVMSQVHGSVREVTAGWAPIGKFRTRLRPIGQPQQRWVRVSDPHPCAPVRPRTGSEPAPSGAVTVPGGSATPVPAGGTSEGSGGSRETVPRGGQSVPTPVSFGGKTGGSGGGFRVGMPVILGGGAAAFLAAAFGLFVVLGGGDDPTEATTPGSTAAAAGTTAATAAATSEATTAATEAPVAYDHALAVGLYDVKWGDYLTLDAYAFGLLEETPFANTNDAYAGIPSAELYQSWGASPWSISPGETFLSPGDQQRLSESETLLVAAGVDFWEMSDGARQRVFFNTVFPCGEGVAAFTVCPDLLASSPGGEHVVAYAMFDAEIPLAHPERIYQYGFVFDADGDTSNNYVPLDAYPKDFFADTDRWYALAYTPGIGWQLQVTNARDGQILGVPSAARAMIRGNTIMLVVPASEFEVEAPPYRATAFWHLGDYGFNPPFSWNADVQPPVGEPLLEPAHVVLEMAE